MNQLLTDERKHLDGTNRSKVDQAFNLDPNEYVSMLVDAPPRQVIMLVFVAVTPLLCDEHAHEGFQSVAHKLYKLLGSKQIDPLPTPVKGLLPKLILEYIPSELMVIMTTNQQEWIDEEFYVQTGFLDEIDGQNHDFSDGIVNAMTLYDSFVDITKSLDPNDHNPITADRPSEQLVRYTISDLYRDRYGQWNQALVSYRNMAQIMCDAILMGRDPDVEWNRFVSTGGTYFLEYPRLCP